MATWESRVTCSETYVSGGAENYSNVTITFQIRRRDAPMNGYNGYGQAYYNISCNGSSSGNIYFNFNWNYTSAGTWWTVGSRSFKIPHNSDGSKTISFSGYYYTGISPSSFSASGSKTLTKIPRYANITSFKSSSVTQTSGTFTWNTDATCSGLSYSLNGASWVAISVNKTFTVDNLVPGTSYTLKIRVKRKDSGLTKDSSNVTFTTLPIASISTIPISFNIGEILGLQFQNYENNASFLRMYQKDVNNEWALLDEIADVQTESYQWDSSVFADTLYKNTPNSNSSEFKIICGVELNDVEYINEYIGTANVINSSPFMSDFNFMNTDTKSAEMLGDTSSMVTYIGNLRVSIITKATPQNYATISYYNISVSDGSNTTVKKVDETTSALDVDFGNYQNAGVYSIKVEAVDSRGNISNIAEKTFNVYVYHTPTMTVTLERVNNFEKETSITFAGYISRVYTTDDRNNKVVLQYRFKENSSQTWSEYVDISNTSNIVGDDIKLEYFNAIFEVLDVSKAYDFEFVLEDKIQSTILQASVGQGVPLMTIADSGVVLVNDVPDSANLTSDCALVVGTDIGVRNSSGGQEKVLEAIAKKIVFTESEAVEPQNTTVDSLWCPIIGTIELSSLDVPEGETDPEGGTDEDV